ncbi:MAG: non-ribosomal peptide synthetase [Janthinobacterium lividum]
MNSKKAYYLEPVDFNPFTGPEIEQRIPLSKPQEEIWLSCMLGGDDASRCYNESVSLKLSGLLNKHALQQALQDLVQRHQSLRCSFKNDGTEIFIYQDQSIKLVIKDLSLINDQEKQQTIDTFLQEEALKTYDLANGPLFRTTLFKLTEQEYHFTFSAHHIICDGWSLGILLQDLSKLYSAYQQNTKPMLPKVAQMSDYVSEQLQAIQTETYVQTKQFWLDQFATKIPETLLPTEFPRPKTRTYKSRRNDFKLNPQLIAAIKKTGAKTGCSFVVTLLSAFEIWLHQLTKQQDIVLGLPAAGQSVAGYYGLTGHCVNLLPLKSSYQPETTFNSYLKQRKSEVLDALEHQQFSLGSLLKLLPIKRDASRIPLIPVVFNMDMNMDDGVVFTGLSHQLHYNARAFETFELFLNASGSEKDLTLEWSYNTQLFKPETIQKMMTGFEKLLHQVSNYPDNFLEAISFQTNTLSVNSQKNIDKRSITYPETQLPEIISESLKKHAVKTAIRFRETEISNGNLLAKANQMAAMLIEKGIRRGDLVGVSLDRSIEMIVSLLAILKAGAAYIPLDPNYPQERINYMLNDAKAGFLLINQKYSGRFTSAAIEILQEDILQEMNTYPTADPEIKISGSDLAYVLYTSGSTGKPKGVQIEHHSLLNLLQSIQKWPGITSEDRMLALTTISFDIAGLELFLPLIAGAEIILADTETAKNGRELLELIKTTNVSLIQATPATFRLLLDAGWKQPLPLRVFCCGEAMQPDLAEKLLPLCAGLYNMYGPTETTIYSTGKQILENEPITIGFPLDQTQVYIFNEANKVVPHGEIGEIFIAGDGVARGYLNQPELTATRFYDDPFAATLGNKMYRTGDVGRFLQKNEIEYLGRVDHQVKIRGHRVELGEIEAILARQEKVTQSVVVVREDQPGNQQLVAYVSAQDVSKNVEQQWINIWKIALKEVLPPFMVPAQIILLDAFPLTPNNKIDRKALPKPEVLSADISEFTSPRTSVEKLVADIWCQVLGRHAISIYDNFFEIGGHSLLAVQIMSRIEKETGKRLPLASFFESSTIAALALLLHMDGQSITWDSLVPIKAKGSKTPLYIVHGAGLNVLLFNTLAMHMDQEQPVYGLQAKGLNGIDQPLDKLEDIAAHYISEIIRHNPNGPYALAGYSFGGTIAYEMAKQLQAMGKKIKMLALFDSYANQTELTYPKYVRVLHKIRDYSCRFFYTFVLLAKQPVNTITYKMLMFRRKLITYYWKWRNKNEEQIGFFGYSHKIDEMNQKAAAEYFITPYNGQIDLFRAKVKTYYMQDPHYLGWKKFALKGVQVHEIPGDHNYIFAPPNDKEFATVLQECLNQTTS